MKRLIFPMIMVILLVSCSGENDIYNINKKIMNMKSYSVCADITIYGNKGTSEYKVKQYFDSDKIRIETLEPDFLKGKTVIYNGTKCSIYHPLINFKMVVDNYKADNFTHIGIIQEGILSDEKAEYSKTNIDGIGYIKIKCKIPNGNEYRKYAILYVSKKEYYPERMEILDDKGKNVVMIRYSDFSYNCDLEDSLFNVD